MTDAQYDDLMAQIERAGNLPEPKPDTTKDSYRCPVCVLFMVGVVLTITAVIVCFGFNR